MKKAQLTVTFHIGNTQVEQLSEEQLEVMAKRISEAMSVYYTARPEEYQNIQKRG